MGSTDDETKKLQDELDAKPKVALVAGYEDITSNEFLQHYLKPLDAAIKHNDSFVLSNQAGASAIAFGYLKSKTVPANRITVYRNAESHETDSVLSPPPGSDQSRDYSVQTVQGGEAERTAALLKASDYQILWLRPGDTLEKAGVVSASDVLKARFTGLREVERLAKAKGIKMAMDAYDEIA